jgi:CRP/FNR family cyclic AMP-dependent transcriptional regulator
MISPELLRRYPFFGFLDDAQLRAVAMLAEEEHCAAGETLFDFESPANALYLLVEGGVEHSYVFVNHDGLGRHKEFFIGEISPGEIFGLSALIEPYVYSATCRASVSSRVIKIEAAGLRAVCEVDPHLAYALMRQVAKAVMSRLTDTRVQLVAARA